MANSSLEFLRLTQKLHALEDSGEWQAGLNLLNQSQVARLSAHDPGIKEQVDTYRVIFYSGLEEQKRQERAALKEQRLEKKVTALREIRGDWSKIIELAEEILNLAPDHQYASQYLNYAKMQIEHEKVAAAEREAAEARAEKERLVQEEAMRKEAAEREVAKALAEKERRVKEEAERIAAEREAAEAHAEKERQRVLALSGADSFSLVTQWLDNTQRPHTEATITESQKALAKSGQPAAFILPTPKIPDSLHEDQARDVSAKFAESGDGDPAIMPVAMDDWTVVDPLAETKEAIQEGNLIRAFEMLRGKILGSNDHYEMITSIASKLPGQHEEIRLNWQNLCMRLFTSFAEDDNCPAVIELMGDNVKEMRSTAPLDLIQQLQKIFTEEKLTPEIALALAKLCNDCNEEDSAASTFHTGSLGKRKKGDPRQIAKAQRMFCSKAPEGKERMTLHIEACRKLVQIISYDFQAKNIPEFASYVRELHEMRYEGVSKICDLAFSIWFEKLPKASLEDAKRWAAVLQTLPVTTQTKAAFLLAIADKAMQENNTEDTIKFTLAALDALPEATTPKETQNHQRLLLQMGTFLQYSQHAPIPDEIIKVCEEFDPNFHKG